MKKRNPLSLWSFTFRPQYYLTHPHKWIRELYLNIKNFIHRGRYGYAYVDVWNWCNWFPTVGAEALRYLAEHGNGYPSVAPWETPEKWCQYLKETAEKLDWCRMTCDIVPEHHNTLNQYSKQMDELRSVTSSWRDTMTNENIELHKKYWDREKELNAQDDEQRIVIFSEIGKNLPRFWD